MRRVANMGSDVLFICSRAGNSSELPSVLRVRASIWGKIENERINSGASAQSRRFRIVLAGARPTGVSKGNHVRPGYNHPKCNNRQESGAVGGQKLEQ